MAVCVTRAALNAPHNHLTLLRRCPPLIAALQQTYRPTILHCQYSTHTDMSFEEYRKLRRALKTRARLAGVPLAFLGMGMSSLINVQLNPRMFEMSPEEVQLIWWVGVVRA